MDDSGTHAIALDTSAVYRIKIQGRLDPSWITNMCDMTVHHDIGQDQRVVTTITGELADQAALMGILNLVYDLRCPLLSLETLS